MTKLQPNTIEEIRLLLDQQPIIDVTNIQASSYIEIPNVITMTCDIGGVDET